jgi:hypothetical protein
MLQYILFPNGYFIVNATNDYFQLPVLIKTKIKAMLYDGSDFETVSIQKWEKLTDKITPKNLTGNKELSAIYEKTRNARKSFDEFEQEMADIEWLLATADKNYA